MLKIVEESLDSLELLTAVADSVPAKVCARTSKIMPPMKFIYFFNTNLDFLKSAQFKNFPAHDARKLEGTLVLGGEKLKKHRLKSTVQ